MKSNELRLGNLVLFENEIQEISSIHSDNTIRLRKNKDANCHGCYNSNRLTPVQLTIEWLIKFNVNEIKKQDSLRVNYVKYFKMENKFNYCLGFYFDKDGFVDNIFKEIKYVHELQNLYFALTGSEIQVNVA